MRARSIKGRSIFLGQCHSKSARGLKRPKRACARRRSRLRRAVLRFRNGRFLPAVDGDSSAESRRGPAGRRDLGGEAQAELLQLRDQVIRRIRVFGVLGEFIVSLQRGI